VSDEERIKALRLALDQLLSACERLDSYEIGSTDFWAAYHFAGNIMDEAHSRPVEPCPFYGTPCEYVAAGGRICALIDAARLEGIRLGLEAAAREAAKGSDRLDGEWREGCKTDNHLAGQSDGMDEAAGLIRALDPATIAREAVLDKLVSEAQEQGMGYE